MTTQTKKFIDPKDVIALYFECAGCKASFSLPLAEKIDVKKLAVCPHCQRPWLRSVEGSSIETALSECIEKLKALSSYLGKAPYNGFTLKFEITKENEDYVRAKPIESP
jgi:DNA-directed RNA polymerase subunit RPC12/RpoP